MQSGISEKMKKLIENGTVPSPPAVTTVSWDKWKIRFVFAVFQVSLCTPSENTPTESLARLVSMVFQWFHSTAYMMDDEVGSLVEKLKPQFVTKWLKTVCDVRFDVMVMCLLPKPMEFARVRIFSVFCLKIL